MKNNLKYYRKRKGLTQFQLGMKLNIDPTQISRIERSGKCNLDVAFLLAKELDTTIEELFFSEKKIEE